MIRISQLLSEILTPIGNSLEILQLNYSARDVLITVSFTAL